MRARAIPGITRQATTDLAVLKPFDPARRTAHDPLMASRFIAGMDWRHALGIGLVVCLYPAIAHAQSHYTYAQAFSALWKWIPFIVKSGFLFNILISFFSMAVGTLAGIALGLMQISPLRLISLPAKVITQLFRNSPWLVLLFIVLLAFPFEVEAFGFIIPFPAWIKAVIGLSLPVMANIAEVVRGAVLSVPSGQWEAAESLAFSRRQTLFEIILPQCYKRMIPPWMNWYAILTMATPLCSLLGVEELINLSRQAIEAEDNHPELLVPFFGFALLIFFAYCYPIARLTIRLERKFAVKL
ncbi:MAG: amino acid ABC transporter permease [Rhodobiaceae bacterium]|nr:amino acid ABC transporter permease [Rhodobiaceae bacterium]MCC0040766.1 amino acid ABC transporter permease [Rhodobiaceae bacterium]MCC0053593.1 amino acid ABC transporter permease [Rhodobiaceae bacterium]